MSATQVKLQQKALQRWGKPMTEDQDRKQFCQPGWTYDEWIQANPTYAKRLAAGEVKVLDQRLVTCLPEQTQDYSSKAYRVNITPKKAKELRSLGYSYVKRGQAFVPKSQCVEQNGTIMFPVWCLK